MNFQLTAWQARVAANHGAAAQGRSGDTRKGNCIHISEFDHRLRRWRHLGGRGQGRRVPPQPRPARWRTAGSLEVRQKAASQAQQGVSRGHSGGGSAQHSSAKKKKRATAEGQGPNAVVESILGDSKEKLVLKRTNRLKRSQRKTLAIMCAALDRANQKK